MWPLGRKPTRFPGKVDHHPKKGFINWWENIFCDDGMKKTSRQAAKKEIQEELNYIELDEV
jgi:hypothetical protein